jgi:glutamine synthetase
MSVTLDNLSTDMDTRTGENRMETMILAEYIWIDGAVPVRTLRSKTRVLAAPSGAAVTLADLPAWSFDGSSTFQATGNDSDLTLAPVRVAPDPIRGGGNVLVLCEVLNADGTPHDSNSRARLREVLDAGAADAEPYFGFEQEYALLRDGRPLGFPVHGEPGPQGPYYCSIGADVAFGRPVVEAHTLACLDAGLMLYGTNGEVLPGQWEFQIGYRGIEPADPLTVADHLWLARWLLHRIGEEHGITASLEQKPVKGDWNGSGKHTNFSTKAMRAPETGAEAIREAVAALSSFHAEHIAVYGHGIEERLTGAHETCSVGEFRSGVADRGSSIRIPRHVAAVGHGYLEDRRPGANADPYEVTAQILKTVCGTRSLDTAGYEPGQQIERVLEEAYPGD